MPKIEFINHASVLISDDNIGILTDPWYEGDVFNKGWNLLINQSDKEIEDTLEKTNYIWVSHEHPDHFSVNFFIKYKNLIQERKIKILFQKTLDSRVTNFLKSKSFEVIELTDKKTYSLNERLKVKVIKVDFYDSAQIFEFDDIRVVNMNDCPFESDLELKKFAKKVGKADLLLSQFSYAAWKGGKENKKWRQDAAREKLVTLRRQAQVLECEKIIPFASFIYFSNKENMYLNDSHNRPSDVIDYFKNSKITPYIFKPFEKQSISELKQDPSSIAFWDNVFNKINNFNYYTYDKSFNFDELKLEHKKYIDNIFRKNSKFLIYILHKIKIFNAFSDLNIYLHDQNLYINLSMFSGLTILKDKKFDIKIHSNSLMFIFKNEFGFDTLSVNGNFECNRKNFAKVTKHLAIGSLNAMGRNISFKALLNFSIYLLFLKRLSRVRRKLT